MIYPTTWDILQRDNIINHKDNCIPMFIAALFTAVKIWNESKHPAGDKWIKNSSIFIKTMECYLARKTMRSHHLQQQGWKWRSLG